MIDAEGEFTPRGAPSKLCLGGVGFQIGANTNCSRRIAVHSDSISTIPTAPVR